MTTREDNYSRRCASKVITDLPGEPEPIVPGYPIVPGEPSPEVPPPHRPLPDEPITPILPGKPAPSKQDQAGSTGTVA